MAAWTATAILGLGGTSVVTNSKGLAMVSQRIGRFALVWVVTAACAVGGWCHGSSAWAQLTAENLIGDSVTNPTDAKYSDISEAIKRYNNRDVLSARQFLESARRKDDKLPPVDILLARMHFLTGNGQAGLVALEAAIRDNRTDPEPYLLLADQAFATGQAIQASALYDKVIALTEAYNDNAKRKRRFAIRARAGRSAVAQRWEDWAAAEADIKVWLEADPEDANAHSRMGFVQFMLNKPKEGFESFQKSFGLNKELAPPYVAAASMYERLGKRDEAKQAFERAYSEDPKNRTTIISYGEWLVKTGQIDAAKAMLAKAKAAVPGSFEVLLLEGLASTMTGDAKSAEQSYMQALALSPSNRDIYNQLALLLISQPADEQKQRAAAFAQVNAQLYENNADVNITLSWVLYQLGRAADANTAYQKGVRLGVLSPDSRYLVAKMLVDQDKRDVAQQLLAEALADTNGIFVMRKEAEALQATLKK